MIDRPLSVSRVSPPTAIIRTTSAKSTISHSRTAFRAPRRAPSINPPLGACRRFLGAANFFEYAAFLSHSALSFADATLGAAPQIVQSSLRVFQPQDLAQNSVQHLHIGARKRHPRPEIAKVDLHAIGLGLGIEKPGLAEARS